MNDYNRLLEQIPLFQGIGQEERGKLLECLGARRRQYVADSVILLAGQPAGRIGIVLEGRVRIAREEFSGNRLLVAELGPGELFAEAFAFVGAAVMPVSVLSAAESVVLMLDGWKIAAPCQIPCECHGRLLRNMLMVLSGKNLLLNRRMGHLSQRTTREKLLSYLSEQAAINNGNSFEIPFNRQELADYLCVERSAMCAALGRLRDEGVLTFHRNRFTLRKH